MKLYHWLVAVTAVVLAGGCGNSGSSGGDGAAGSAKPGIDVASFQGGYGIDFFQKCAEEYGKQKGVAAKVWGDPRVWEQLRPKFVQGAPPDFTWPGWGMDYWQLITEGQVMDLTAELDKPAWDGKTKWRDTFEPSLLKLGQDEGKQYMLPYHFNINGWWYNKTLFEKNGWKPPQTWEEFLILGEKIKAKGVAPFTFQGQYPYYSLFGMVWPWAIGIGGTEVMTEIDNLAPGVWKSPPVLLAVKMIDEMRSKGFFEEGATGLSHTDSQSDFLNGKAAMIPCGSWLHSEMKNVWPAGVVAEFMLPPMPAGCREPSNICVAIEPWIVPTKAKNPMGGIDFYKYMTSIEKAEQFVEEKGTLMAIKGTDSAKLPENLVVPSRLFKASKAVWSPQMNTWYPALKKEVENALSALMSGEIKPEEFCERAEAAAEACRNDPKIKKHVKA